MPFELRPYPAPTLRPDGEYLQRAWRQSVYPIAARLGIEIRLPEVSPQPYTRKAFEGLEFAKAHGKGNEYNRRVMRAFFQESFDIGDVGALAALAAEVGLNGAEFREAVEGGTYAGQVKALLENAYGMGIEGVPYFVIGGRALSGLQSRDALERAIEEAVGELRSPRG